MLATLAKSSAALLMLAPFASCSSGVTTVHTDDLFPTATEVRLFVDSGEISETGDFIWTQERGRKLNAEQRKQLDSLLFVGPAPDEMTACFIPHHFFRYYDPKGKQLGEVAICFCCGGAEVSPDRVQVGMFEELNFNASAAEELVRSMGEPTDVGCD